MFTKQSTPVDRVYKLIGRSAPISFMLPSRNTKRFPVLYYDEKQNVNRPLRYSVNQKSPFEDEQDSNFILEAVIFDNGFLTVPKSNPVLQAFLFYHPLNGKSFAEVDLEKDASAEVELLTAEVDALIAARSLSIGQMENLTRVLFGKDPSFISSSILKRDILIYARSNSQEFLDCLSNPEMAVESQTRSFFDKKLLAFRNNQRDVHFNLKGNKTRMLSVPFGNDPYKEVSSFFKTEDGIEVLKTLDAYIEGMDE